MFMFCKFFFLTAMTEKNQTNKWEWLSCNYSNNRTAAVVGATNSNTQ